MVKILGDGEYTKHLTFTDIDAFSASAKAKIEKPGTASKTPGKPYAKIDKSSKVKKSVKKFKVEGGRLKVEAKTVQKKEAPKKIEAPKKVETPKVEPKKPTTAGKPEVKKIEPKKIETQKTPVKKVVAKPAAKPVTKKPVEKAPVKKVLAKPAPKKAK